jgi:hypothetical protein
MNLSKVLAVIIDSNFHFNQLKFDALTHLFDYLYTGIIYNKG